MKTTWLSQWNRWQFLTTQLTLISVLFLYVLVSLKASLVLSLFIVIALSTILAQWISTSLYPLIDHARLQGDFKVMRNTLIIHLIHLLLGIGLFGASAVVMLQWLGGTSYSTLGLLVIAVVAIDKVLSATLRAQATSIVLQAHALRRLVLIAGLMIGLVVRLQPWLDVVLFVVLIAAPLSSLIRLVVGHAQMYKEFRYRRQFEDSGKQVSLLSLFVSLTSRYASSFVTVALPLGLLLVVGALMQAIGLAQTTASVKDSLLLFLGMIALARTLVATVLPTTSQWTPFVQAGNYSVLREQLGATSEQLLYRSLIFGVVWLGAGFVLGPTVYDSLALLLAAVAVVIVASFYLFDQRVLGLLRKREQWLIVLVALVIFAGNSYLLLIYYPEVALMIAFVMSVVWLHTASLLVWTRSFAFELRIHLRQSVTMIGIVVAAILVNAGIYWLLRQFPLGVGQFVEQLVFLGLFAIITSVVIYSLTFAFGIHRSLKSRSEISQQLSNQFIDYEEEEAIW